MDYCNAFEKLPKFIVEKLKDAPLFFSKDYEQNVHDRGQKNLYIWSSSIILVARIRKQWFMQAALLECEPFVYNVIETEDVTSFLNEAMKILKKVGVQWTITTNTARFHYYPEKAKTILSGNYIIDLTLPEDQLWQNVHSKHRNSIRRGEKGGIEMTCGHEDLINQYTFLSNETYQRSGQATTSREYYAGLIKHLNNNSLIALACKEGIEQAGGMFLYNSACAYYLHGASTFRPEPGSTNYLLWEIIKQMKEKGVKEFSFVGYHVNAEPGSKLEGIQNFKERFGGKLENCYSFKYIQSCFFYKLYCFIMRLKSKNILKKYRDHIDQQIDQYPELNKKVDKK